MGGRRDDRSAGSAAWRTLSVLRGKPTMSPHRSGFELRLGAAWRRLDWYGKHSPVGPPAGEVVSPDLCRRSHTSTTAGGNGGPPAAGPSRTRRSIFGFRKVLF